MKELIFWSCMVIQALWVGVDGSGSVYGIQCVPPSASNLPEPPSSDFPYYADGRSMIFLSLFHHDFCSLCGCFVQFDFDFVHCRQSVGF